MYHYILNKNNINQYLIFGLIFNLIILQYYCNLGKTFQAIRAFYGLYIARNARSCMQVVVSALTC